MITAETGHGLPDGGVAVEVMGRGVYGRVPRLDLSLPPLYNAADLNCNGAVNAQDTTLFRQLLGSPPGPSGLVP